MKKNFRHWVAAALGTAAAFAFSSCAYDPYYSSVGGSYSSGYSSGYGEGYGYGGSNFSTSLFVTTGDPRWGYDPNCYSYYDYHTRRYYDPYLYGYYPIGYRPRVVYGAPHPYGWRPGGGYCPPPRSVRNVTVVNYRNRESAYRNSNYSWAKKVYSKPSPQHRTQRQEPSRSSSGNSRTYDRSSSPTPSTRTSPYGSQNPPNRDSYKSRQNLESVAAPSRNQSNNRNSRDSTRAPEAPSRQPGSNQQNSRTPREFHRPSESPSHSRSRSESRPAPPASKRLEDRIKSEDSKSEPMKRSKIRSLGEG